MDFYAKFVVIFFTCLRLSYCRPPNIVFVLTDDQDVEIGGMVSTRRAFLLATLHFVFCCCQFSQLYCCIVENRLSSSSSCILVLPTRAGFQTGKDIFGRNITMV